MTVSGFADRLLGWYARHRRDLPWRRTADPWAVWVSEVMLQQTRVEAVRAAYARFLLDYPTPSAWAAATDDEMLAAWKGLGYYRRARLLRDGARAVVERHGGEVPADPRALRALPGVGAYTSGAIASIAFGLPEPAVDGNVERVVARHRGVEGLVKRAATARAIAEVVRGWHREAGRPTDLTQALMELGALVCLPRAPACAECPVASDCAARIQGRQSELPRTVPRRPSVPVRARVVLVDAGRGRVLARRVPSDEVNSGQVELPGPGLLVDLPDARALAEVLRARFATRFEVGEVVARARHAITNHRILVEAHRATVRGPLGPGLFAAAADDEAIPWTTASRKILDPG